MIPKRYQCEGSEREGRGLWVRNGGGVVLQLLFPSDLDRPK